MKSIITCDMEGIILTMNTGAEKIFGYQKRINWKTKSFIIFTR